MKSFFTVVTMLSAMTASGIEEKKWYGYWSDPRKNIDTFMQELDQLPTYIKSHQYDSAFNELNVKLSAWTKDRRLICPNGYNNAIKKIENIFNQYVNERDLKVVHRMLPFMIQPRTFGQLYSPMRILAKNEDRIDKTNALWILYNADQDTIAQEMVFNDPDTLKSALPYIPLDMRVLLLKEAKDLKLSEGLDYDMRHGMEMHRTGNINALESFDANNSNKDFEKFFNEREICIAECVADERRFAALESASASAPSDKKITE